MLAPFGPGTLPVNVEAESQLRVRRFDRVKKLQVFSGASVVHGPYQKIDRGVLAPFVKELKKIGFTVHHGDDPGVRHLTGDSPAVAHALDPAIGVLLLNGNLARAPLVLFRPGFRSKTLRAQHAEDIVVLLGQYGDSSPYAFEHYFALSDGAKGAETILGLGPKSGGYDGELQFADVTGNGILDTLIGLPTGGSGGIIHYVLVSTATGRPRILFDGVHENQGAKLDIALMDGFKVRIHSPQLDRTFTIALQVEDEPSQTSIYERVYAQDGTLLEPVAGVADPFGWMEPGTDELVAYQQLWVLFHANTVAVARSVWRWNGSGFTLANLEILSQADALRDLGRR